MNRRTFILVGTLFAGAAVGLGAQASARVAPKFEVDPMWPKPLPNRWILGSVTGVATDARDHVYVLNIPDYFNARTEIGSGTTPPTGDCCTPAPPVLEFDAAGTLVGHWGGPGNGYDWPVTPRGIAVDKDGNVWIGGSGGTDTRLLKFSRDGKFIAAIGKTVAAPSAPAAAAPADTAYAGASNRGGAAGRGAAGRGRGRGRGAGPSLPANSTSMESFGGAANIAFDPATNEAFIADGYRNRRIAVVDMSTGAIKRFWGASGNPPEDTPGAAQFGTPVHCAEVSKDGLVYVCDRANDRIQVFKKDGSFVTETKVAPNTRGDGSVWDIAFSSDAQQKYLYVADGMNMKVWVLDRKTLGQVSSFGDGGRQPGQFYAVDAIATDSKGNLYTGETYEGKRVQKFVYRGTGPATPDAGVVWPRAGRSGGGR